MTRWAAAVDGWTDWMVAAGRSPGTIQTRRKQVRAAAAGLRRNPWRVTNRDLVTWLAAQGWSANTRRGYRSALHSFYDWGVRDGRTRRNPADALPPVKSVPALPRPTPEHVLEVALLTVSDRDRFILLLAGFAGLRRAEIAGLRWEDVSYEAGAGGGSNQGVVRIAGLRESEGSTTTADTHMGRPSALNLRVTGKGGRTRVVPVHPVLARELAAERLRRDAGGSGSGYRYTSGLDGPWLFPGRDGGHLNPAAVGLAASRALGPGWTGHTLRHRFCTRTFEISKNLMLVKQLAGHSKMDTTMGYVAVNPRDAADLIERL